VVVSLAGTRIVRVHVLINLYSVFVVLKPPQVVKVERVVLVDVTVTVSCTVGVEG
jgi:hypothetical protein